MPDQKLKEADKAMDRAVEAVAREFNTVRTGKATPALLDTVRVEAYGALVPLKQIANVSAPEPQMLLVQPYDPNITGAIAKSIRAADLGLNPAQDAELVRVPIPPLTEERRKEMVKLLHRMAEEGKVSIRHTRQETKNTLHDMQRNGDIGEDLYHHKLDELQKLTDGHTEKIDELLVHKEAEVMEV
jgi:ribosome recycling factor